MDTLGKRIKFIREQLRLNQSELAKYLGLESPMAISKYESDQREPDIDKLVKLGKLGDLSLDWLLSGHGWTYSPSTSSRASEWMTKQLNVDIKRIVIVTYYDEVNGLANGFILEKNNGFVSMEGGSTRSGYMGGGPKIYHELLEIIRDKKISTGQIKFREGETPDWDKMDVASLVVSASFSKDIIAHELHVLRPDKHPSQVQEPTDEYRANSDPDLLEVINWLKNNPQDKELILKLIKGRKYIKEAINGLKG